MAVTVNAATAGINIVAQNAKADLTIGTDIVAFHLTEGFNISTVEAGGEPGPAFTAVGHVKINKGPGDNLNGWKFGFIQFARANFTGVFYAGRISSEGSVSIIMHEPPALPNALLLDSKAPFTPFTRPEPRFDEFANEVSAGTSDHPATKVPKTFRNSLKNVKNFLFHFIDRREFWSVFTAIDPTGRKQHLAHMHWTQSHNVKFNWHGGNPVVASKITNFQFDRNVSGPPTEPELQPLLQNPVPPQFNNAAGEAIKLAFLGPRGPNRSENPSWFNNVPINFFQ